MISVETYILGKKYTDEQIEHVEEVAIEEAVTEAVAIAKMYTDEQVELFKWKIEFVETLPSKDIDTHTIYFVPMSPRDDANNCYYEYIYVNNVWEMIGSTEFKPENYMTKKEIEEYVEAYVEAHKYVLQPATADELGGVMVNTDTIQLETDGKISIVSIGTNDIANLFY